MRGRSSLSMCAKLRAGINREALDGLYDEYNRRDFVSPDPLEFVWLYDDPLDREIVGLISSSLAYGRVAQILRSVSTVLDRMGDPSAFLRNSTLESLRHTFSGFRHRFTAGQDLALMLHGASAAIDKYGSLEACFTAGMNSGDETVLPALESFVRELGVDSGGDGSYLLPLPSRGSACKRLNLFLRWMVREDEVDPGGWHGVPASKLVVPLDTHMYQICRVLGMTRRKQANAKTALEITYFFRELVPEDPVKYDFCLTRLGILDEADLPRFLEKWSVDEVA